MLTEKEVEEIRKGLAEGLGGPVVLKWVRQILADRDERVRLERERVGAGSDRSLGLR